MYAPGDDGEEELKQDILDLYAGAAGDNGYVVISSSPFRDVDPKSANPPHLLARDAYDSIAPSGVLCTGEYPDPHDPRPVVFGLVDGVGLQLLEVDDDSDAGERAATGTTGAKILKRLALTAAVGGVAVAARHGRRKGLQGARNAVTAARGGEPESLPAVGFGQE